MLGVCSLMGCFSMLPGCGDSMATLNQLAASGAIHEGAPVKTQVAVTIAAPPAKVWALLIDAPSWPRWQNRIASVQAPGPLTKGMNFSWETAGATIHSQVQLFEPEHRLSWTGTAFTAKAIHVWLLTPAGGKQTLLTVKESMDGPFMAHLFSSEALTETDTAWIEALRQKAEQP